MMILRNVVVGMLFITVIAPIALYTDRFAAFAPSSTRIDFLEDVTSFTRPADSGRLNVLPQESTTVLKEPIGVVYTTNLTQSSSDGVASSDAGNQDSISADSQSQDTIEHKYARVLSATDEHDQSHPDAVIKSVTDTTNAKHESRSDGSTDANPKDPKSSTSNRVAHHASQEQLQRQAAGNSGKASEKDHRKAKSGKQTDQTAVIPDARIRQLRDQLIRAKVFLSLPATSNNPHYTRDLRMRVKEVSRVLGEATKDSELPKNAVEKMKSMELALTKGKQIQDDCATGVKKLRAMLHSTEEQLRVHKKQTMFLTQLTAKTLPKGLHCLPLRLTTEYYSLNTSQQQFPNQEKLEDPLLYHYALFSDNVLAASVVVNSTITHAKDPSKHVFHIVTDRLNYAAMRMWFLVNPPGKGTVQVQNIEEFTWLNASYSPVLKQLGSPSMIDYYFRAHRANSDPNLKYRNPKYLSILNHLRFYLPEIFPKLNKVLFVDDDIVVQKDLSALWALDLKGNVNGAVETCGESFHRFDRYLNFSNPLISKNFQPHACGWAYGMNVFDLDQWRRKNITEVYHKWQKLNHDRTLWKLGTLPPGLITFWKQTHPIDRSWHVLGLGYNPSMNQKDIERAAVIHYNGNMKPWLEIGIPKYRGYWEKCACDGEMEVGAMKMPGRSGTASQLFALISALLCCCASLHPRLVSPYLKSLERGRFRKAFNVLVEQLEGTPVDFELPEWLFNKAKPMPYTFIRRNIYLTKRIKRRLEDDGIFCSCNASPGSSGVCSRDCHCGMLLSSCSSGCKCGESCLNKPFHQRPMKKMKMIQTDKCGVGIVADEEIKRGEFVIEYVGEVIDDKTCEARLWNMKHRGETNFYLCEINRNMVIDATYKGNKSRYINHSCCPNTEMQKWIIDGETRIGIFATRDIKKGEHLTYDYHPSNKVSRFVQFGADQDCHCGADDCRRKLGVKPTKAKLSSDAALHLVTCQVAVSSPRIKAILSGENVLQNGSIHKGSSGCADDNRQSYHSCIGKVIKIVDSKNESFGIIRQFDQYSRKHKIMFEDGTVRFLDLTKVQWEICDF
ncbi:Probable galacturonosyltransferase 4 [Linum grandiflorum]